MDTLRTARVCAAICVVGAAAAALLAAAQLAGFQPADESPYLIPIYIATLLGVVGLALTGAAAGTVGLAGVGIAAVGLLGFLVAEITAPGPTSDTIYAVVPLVTALGMVLAGVAVLRSRRWSGWHRYAPLAIGGWIVVVVVPVMALAGGDGPGLGSPAATVAVGAWHLLWVALGVAVLGETGSRQRVSA